MKIRNTTTGEIKDIPDTQASQYGINNQSQQPKQKGLLESLLSVPLDFGKLAGSALYEGGRAGLSALGAKDVYNAQNPFMSNEDLANYSNPLTGGLDALKKTLAMEAMVMPVGKAGILAKIPGLSQLVTHPQYGGLATRGITNFISGAGQTLGDNNNNLGNMLGAGLSSAVLGEGLRAASRPIFAASLGKGGLKAPELNIGPSKNIASAARQANLGSGKFQQELDSLISGKPSITRNEITAKVNELAPNLNWENRPVTTFLSGRKPSAKNPADVFLSFLRNELDTQGNPLNYNQQLPADVVNQLKGEIWKSAYAKGGNKEVQQKFMEPLGGFFKGAVEKASGNPQRVQEINKILGAAASIGKQSQSGGEGLLGMLKRAGLPVSGIGLGGLLYLLHNPVAATAMASLGLLRIPAVSTTLGSGLASQGAAKAGDILNSQLFSNGSQ